MYVCIIYIMFFFLKKSNKFILLTPFRFLWWFFEDVSFVYLMRLVCLIWKDEVKHSLVVSGLEQMSSDEFF